MTTTLEFNKRCKVVRTELATHKNYWSKCKKYLLRWSQIELGRSKSVDLGYRAKWYAMTVDEHGQLRIYTEHTKRGPAERSLQGLHTNRLATRCTSGTKPLKLRAGQVRTRSK